MRKALNETVFRMPDMPVGNKNDKFTSVRRSKIWWKSPPTHSCPEAHKIWFQHISTMTGIISDSFNRKECRLNYPHHIRNYSAPVSAAWEHFVFRVLFCKDSVLNCFFAKTSAHHILALKSVWIGSLTDCVWGLMKIFQRDIFRQCDSRLKKAWKKHRFEDWADGSQKIWRNRCLIWNISISVRLFMLYELSRAQCFFRGGL